ncbi:MAG: hypothetical protein PHU54_07990 [Candidatus Omnitrophica bacterium]|nr:hypothetical protein [Candidatus Omnitrophota bacterium]
MSDCVDCGEMLADGITGKTICVDCAGKRADALTHEQMLAMAKTGLIALIDEKTGYQKIRRKDELKEIHERGK